MCPSGRDVGETTPCLSLIVLKAHRLYPNPHLFPPGLLAHIALTFNVDVHPLTLLPFSPIFSYYPLVLSPRTLSP